MSALEVAVLSAALAGLAAVAVWLLLGMRIKMPAGRRISLAIGDREVHVVIDPAVSVEIPPALHRSLAACSHFAWGCALEGWERRFGRRPSCPDELVVLFLADEWFDSGPFRGYAAYQVWTGAGVGRGAPMAVIRSSLAREVELTGEPVIHEALHLLAEENRGEPDAGHSDPAVWNAIEGSTKSAQSAARELYEATR